MKKLDELEIIKIFQNSFGSKSKFVPEDVETVQLGNTTIVTKSDMLVESTDVPLGMKINEISKKSLVSCVSDFASKGVKPEYAIISLSIPRKFSIAKIKKLAIGFRQAANEFGVKIVGGDVNEGKELVINVSLIGKAKKIVPRHGAKAGDIIITSGPFGHTLAGLHVILNKAMAPKAAKKLFKKKVFRPTTRLRFGLAIRKYLSSSMDSSDGLSSTIHDISKQSKKKFIITKLPTDSAVVEFSRKNRISLLDLVFNGGEEYEIVATVPPKNILEVRRLAKINKIRLFEIGYVTKGIGVILRQKTKTINIENKGWLHFQS